MNFHHGASPSVITATTYKLTATTDRHDPAARQQLCALAAWDGQRLQEVREYFGARVTDADDRPWEQRALHLIDDTLVHLHKQRAPTI